MTIHYVNVPVTDLRREPVAASSVGGKDSLQESQLLHGEAVIVHDVRDGWARVEVVSQQKCTKEGEWRGYPGWINAVHLSDTKPSLDISILPWKVSALDIRSLLVERAHYFLGMPYLWGGRSPYDPAVTTARTGVDCSGMVHLLYQSIGIELPRDAHDQYLVTTRCDINELLPGDLIFSCDTTKSQRIDHVMLYVGDAALIEAAMTPNCVHKLELKNKFTSENTEFSFSKLRLFCMQNIESCYSKNQSTNS